MMRVLRDCSGFYPIFREDEGAFMDFAILKLKGDKALYERTLKQSAYLLLNGNLRICDGQQELSCERKNIFRDASPLFQFPVGREIEIHPMGPVEIAIFRKKGNSDFQFLQDDAREEKNAGYLTRVFDTSSSFLIGELVGQKNVRMPQVEGMCHYRFESGAGELLMKGETLSIKNGESVKVSRQAFTKSLAASYCLWVSPKKIAPAELVQRWEFFF